MHAGIEKIPREMEVGETTLSLLEASMLSHNKFPFRLILLLRVLSHE